MPASHPVISGSDQSAMFMNATKDTELHVHCKIISSQTQNILRDHLCPHNNNKLESSQQQLLFSKGEAYKCVDNNNNNGVKGDLSNNKFNNNIPHLGNGIILSNDGHNNNMHNGAKPEIGISQGCSCSNSYCWSLSNSKSLQPRLTGLSKQMTAAGAPWKQALIESHHPTLHPTLTTTQLDSGPEKCSLTILRDPLSIESQLPTLRFLTLSTTQLDSGPENYSRIIFKGLVNNYYNHHLNKNSINNSCNNNYYSYNNYYNTHHHETHHVTTQWTSYNNNNYNYNSYYNNYYFEPNSARLYSGSTWVGLCSNKLPLALINIGSFQLTRDHSDYGNYHNHNDTILNNYNKYCNYHKHNNCYCNNFRGNYNYNIHKNLICTSYNNNHNTYYNTCYLEPYSARLYTGSTLVGFCSKKLLLFRINLGSFQLTSVNYFFKLAPLLVHCCKAANDRNYITPRCLFYDHDNYYNHNDSNLSHNHNSSICNICIYTTYNSYNWNHNNNTDYRHNNINGNYRNYNNSILNICNNKSHRYINWNPNNNTYSRHNNINNIKNNSRNISNKEMHIINGNIDHKKQLPKRRNLVFGWWNCQKGFLNRNKKAELGLFLRENKADVFGVQEVEAYKTTYFYSDLYKIQGYKHFFPISLEKHGRSRCLVYYKEELEELITIRSDLMLPTQPLIWLQLGTRKGPLLAFYYREWTGIDGENSTTAQKARLQKVIEKVSEAVLNDNEVYIMGDLNIEAEAVNNLNTTDPLAKMINNMMLEKGLVQLITKKTRSQIVNNTCKESTIDHLYTNVPETIMGIKIHHTASSDHARVTFKRRKKMVIPRKKITMRSFKRFEETAYLKDLSKVDWERMPVNNVDDATEFLTSSVLKVLDDHAPVTTFIPSSKYNPAISETTKKMMNKRDLAHEKAKQTTNSEDVKEYKKLRNKVVGLIEKDKKEAVEEEMKYGSSAWKALNIMRNRAKSVNGPPTKLILNGKVVTDTKKLATAMNEFFTNKIKKLQDEIQKEEPEYDPVDHFKAHLPDNIETLEWELTTAQEVKEAIENLENSTSSGPDGISNWVLKKSKEALSIPLSRLFNLSLSLATYPSRWKQSTVLPLWKRKSKMDPASYRPISLTCKCSILFEKLMHRRMTSHLKAQQLLPPEQDGYQDGKSTITLTTRTYDKWCRAANMSKYAGVLCIDLSAAFDMVPGAVLVGKARAAGASEHAARWLSSYLSGRTQAVKIGSSVSTVIPIPSSIAQGTAYGPLLFLLAVLDLPKCVQDGKVDTGVQHGGVDMFCDDITDTVTGDNPFAVARQLEKDAENITKWLISNRLCIAKDKTSFMLATNREKPRTQEVEMITIKVAGQIVKQCQHLKLLGIIFQRDLTFSCHLHGTQGENPEKGLIKSLSQIIGLIRSMKNCPKKAKKMFLTSLFNGKLSYGIEVYGALTEGQLHQLQLVQNRAANLVLPGNRIKTSEKLRELGWLNVKETREKMDLMTLFKMRTQRSSPYFERWLRSSRIPAYEKLPTYESNHGKLLQRSWLIRASTCWNELPVEVRKSTPTSFKKTLKRHLLTRQRIEMRL